MAWVEQGDRVAMSVTPDRYTTVRYAGASGDFNPIHIDEDFAREVGLPGRILHGLWSMAQVARAAGSVAPDDPVALRSLSVAFRGMGRMQQEMVVTGSVTGVEDGVAALKLEALQPGADGGKDAKVIKGAVAQVRVS